MTDYQKFAKAVKVAFQEERQELADFFREMRSSECPLPRSVLNHILLQAVRKAKIHYRQRYVSENN